MACKLCQAAGPGSNWRLEGKSKGYNGPPLASYPHPAGTAPGRTGRTDVAGAAPPAQHGTSYIGGCWWTEFFPQGLYKTKWSYWPNQTRWLVCCTHIKVGFTIFVKGEDGSLFTRGQDAIKCLIWYIIRTASCIATASYLSSFHD